MLAYACQSKGDFFFFVVLRFELRASHFLGWQVLYCGRKAGKGKGANERQQGR
jgi:hypothetical protein